MHFGAFQCILRGHGCVWDVEMHFEALGANVMSFWLTVQLVFKELQPSTL